MKTYLPIRVPSVMPTKVKSNDVNSLTSAQVKWFCEYYPDMEDTDIADCLGITEWLVPILAVKHQASKSEPFKEYLKDYQEMQRLEAIGSLRDLSKDVKQNIHNRDLIRGEEFALECSFLKTKSERHMMAKAIADALEWGRAHPSVKEALTAKKE